MGDNHWESVRQYLADFTIHGDDLKATNNAITKDKAKKSHVYVAPERNLRKLELTQTQPKIVEANSQETACTRNIPLRLLSDAVPGCYFQPIQQS